MPLRLAQGSLHGFCLHTCALDGGASSPPARWGRAGKQARGTFDWAHRGSDWGRVVARQTPDGGRQRDSGGGATVARVLAQYEADLSHVWVWELRWGLGKSSASFVGHRHERSTVLTGGGRW
jgi:hypothetical protein